MLPDIDRLRGREALGIRAVGYDLDIAAIACAARPPREIVRKDLHDRGSPDAGVKERPERQNEPALEDALERVAVLKVEDVRQADAKKPQKDQRKRHVRHHRPRAVEALFLLKRARFERGKRHEKHL